MKILLDTNVLLDILLVRDQFFKNSFDAVQSSIDSEFELYAAANTVTDIYYISKKHFRDEIRARDAIVNLLGFAEILDTTFSHITKALKFQMADYEDAVLCATGLDAKVNFIITRNIVDFKNSPLPVLTPKEFLSAH
jgi:predicted nucleic acid-binding protein